MYVQYLKGGDLVFEHFLGFVEVRQHVLRLSAVDGVHFGELPLVPLRQFLFMSPEERGECTVEFLRETTEAAGYYNTMATEDPCS